MKNLLILLFTIPLLSLTVENDKVKLTGKWVGEVNDKIGYINFDENGYAFFEIDGEILGGQESVHEKEKRKMTYEVNDEVNPIEIDLIVTDLNTGEHIKILCIAKFINQDTMEMAFNFDYIRPINFNSEYLIISNRIK